MLKMEKNRVTLDLEKTLSFWSGMNIEGIGVMAGGRWYMSIAHTDGDVDRTLETVDKVMQTL
jgi:glutamate-1-semialdehyde aminotransferase